MVDQPAYPSLTRFTAVANVAGIPALSLPSGFTTDGLSIGLQVLAPPWAEARLLRAAHAYDLATPWHLQEPPA